MTDTDLLAGIRARHDETNQIWEARPRSKFFSVTHADRATLLALCAAKDEVIEAARDLFAMIDEGLLVRDISKDAEPSFAMDALKFTMRLKKTPEALASYDATVERLSKEGAG